MGFGEKVALMFIIALAIVIRKEIKNSKGK